jgi:hypothetical protein
MKKLPLLVRLSWAIVAEEPSLIILSLYLYQKFSLMVEAGGTKKATAAPKGPQKVMVVDDDIFCSQLVKMMLEQIG